MGKPGHFETRILCLLQQSSVTVRLQHSRRPAESQAPFRLLHHHLLKMGRLPLKCLRYPLRLSADQNHRQRTTLTTYAMLLPGSSQASGPAPVLTESAQAINNSSFISQYIGSVNSSIPYLVFLAFSERRAYYALCQRRSSLTYSALAYSTLKVRPFYLSRSGLSRWKRSTYRPAPPRHRAFILSDPEAL